MAFLSARSCVPYMGNTCHIWDIGLPNNIPHSSPINFSQRHCTYRPSVIYLIVNKLLSLSSSPAPRDIPRGVFIEWHTEVWTSSRNLLTLIEARHCPTASPGPRRGLGRGANVLPSQSQCRPARRERHAECPHVIFRNLNKLGRAEVRNEEK